MSEALDVYNKMKSEIETLGWSKIIERYHPDMNPDDPDAAERFRLYTRIYRAMKNEAKGTYSKNQKVYNERIEKQKELNKIKEQSEVLEYYKKAVNRFYYLSVAIVVFVALMIGVKLL